MDLLALKRSLMPMSGPQDMGGGGGGGSGTQTTINELPEWARGYAKNTLEKTAALSEKPYQAYEGARISGFSPMQLQSQQAAANMQTSGATGAGIDIAGAAALGGLGQNYQGGQFQGGQFGGRQAAQYMSPFIEQALAPQLREAQRSSDIMGQQNAAKAVGQGAFGGSRSALVEAERQRNLGMQMGDIRARGLQDAYTQAASQFNADQARAMQAQQLGEQSRQFGANLGLQGLNTALQGAGQLGALGGQQFQQGMDINKLQNAYGGQQQALRQQGLDMAYQDFLNEQNYPYKQLGFMSDMIRGLPLGQQSTQTMYQAPGSVAGQVAGLGVGALGLSKFMAEGGMAYADGGSVDAPDNVERIVSKLSDAQLQQAMKAAQARGDMDQLEAIQDELAMRASERNGMAGAFNQLPQQTQETFTAANGGIVAFSEGGYFQDPMGAPSYERSDYSPFKQNIREGESYTPGLLGMLFGYNQLPAEKKTEAAPAAVASTAATRKDEPAAKPVAKPQVPSGSISSIAKKVSETTGAPEEDFMATYRRLRDEARAESKEEMKGLGEEIGKLAGRSKEIRDQGLARALAEFGFGMAAAASKPGARFIGSAAQASPTLAASALRTDELARAADENAMKLRLTMKQYEIAQRKGDNQTASQMASQMRMLQQTEKQLALKRDELAQQGAYQQGMLGIQRADLARKERGDVIRGASAKAQQDAANARMAGEVRKATLDFENTYGRSLRKQLEEQYGPTKGEYMYNQRKKAYVNDALQVGRDQRADTNAGVQQVFDLLNRED
jgi:hypothetical protein